ncbi:MAG TPA: hypothetical protein VGB66_17365 [Longimicrobium sp.]|jgi:hypothetical protein
MRTHLLLLFLLGVPLAVASPVHAQRISERLVMPTAAPFQDAPGDPIALARRPLDTTVRGAAASRSLRYGIIGAIAGAALGTAVVLSPASCRGPDSMCGLAVPLGAGVGAAAGGFVGALIGAKTD